MSLIGKEIRCSIVALLPSQKTQMIRVGEAKKLVFKNNTCQHVCVPV